MYDVAVATGMKFTERGNAHWNSLMPASPPLSEGIGSQVVVPTGPTDAIEYL
jgi:hypothetical protein